MVDKNLDYIDFFGESDLNFELANFYLRPILLDGKEWPSVEHYFQAQKASDEECKESIRLAATPEEAKTLGRSIKFKQGSDWEEVKVDVMEVATRAKYRQHQDLKKLLLGTGEKTIREHTATDRFWADGGDGTGKNKMGRILMKVREELRNEEK